MFKNTSGQKVTVFAYDYSTGAPKTGDAGNISVYLQKDDGSITQLTDTSASEVSSTNAPGCYLFDVSQTETNADKLVFTGKSSTGNVAIRQETIYTRPAAFGLAGGASGGLMICGTNNGVITFQDSFHINNGFFSNNGAYFNHNDGPGIYIRSGGTAHPALEIIAGATDAQGISVNSSGTAEGIRVTSAGAGAGFKIVSTTGNGLEIDATGGGIAALLKCISTKNCVQLNTSSSTLLGKIVGIFAGISCTAVLSTGDTVTSNTVNFSNGPATSGALTGGYLLAMGSGSVLKVANARKVIDYTYDDGLGIGTATIAGTWPDEATPIATNRPIAFMQGEDVFSAAQAEPTEVPDADASPLDKLAWLAMVARNKIVQTENTQTIRNDGDDADVASADLTRNGTEFTRGSFS